MPFLVRAAAAAALVAGLVVAVLYRGDMHRAHERVAFKSSVVPTPFGDVEYVEDGNGPAVLVVHGSGGGFDQGMLIADSFLSGGFRWIAPSRFGYLRSTFQDGATFDEQAHAYAALLDHLDLERVAVVAFSHGGPSALLFAALHPDRVSSLTLVSCGVSATGAVDQKAADRKGNMLVSIYRYDWLYWASTKVFRRAFMGLMGADREVVASLTRDQRVLVDRIINEMNPVSIRHAGVVFDNGAELPGDRIGVIAAPTLIIHAKDDLLQLYENATFAASTIAHSQLMSFDHGGHLVMVVEQEAIRDAIQNHIRNHKDALTGDT